MSIVPERQSLNAFIPSTHKRLYEEYNAIVFGDMSVAKAAFKGSIAVMGKALIEDFIIGEGKDCHKDSRSVVVAKSLTARMGSISGGYTVMGRSSKVDHTVKMPCTTRIEQYDPKRNGDMDFKPMRSAVIREAADMCISVPNGEVTTENSTMTFQDGEKELSCYSYFKVTTDQLRLVNKWEYAGTDFYRNVVIVISGFRSEFRDFRMVGFNPRRTLVVFCAVYSAMAFSNAKFHASILAPTTSFTAMETIINGSIIVGAIRGSLATLDLPYVTC